MFGLRAAAASSLLAPAPVLGTRWGQAGDGGARRGDPREGAGVPPFPPCAGNFCPGSGSASGRALPPPRPGEEQGQRGFFYRHRHFPTPLDHPPPGSWGPSAGGGCRHRCLPRAGGAQKLRGYAGARAGGRKKGLNPAGVRGDTLKVRLGGKRRAPSAAWGHPVLSGRAAGRERSHRSLPLPLCDFRLPEVPQISIFTASSGATGPGSARPVPPGRAACRATDSRDRRPRGGGVRAPPHPLSPPRAAKGRHCRRARDCLHFLFLFPFPLLFPFASLSHPPGSQWPGSGPDAQRPAPGHPHRAPAGATSPRPRASAGLVSPGQSGVRARRGSAGKYSLSNPPPHPPLRFLSPRLC